MSRPAAQNIPLNLKMSADRVSMGKRLAKEYGTTVSALVSDFFAAMFRVRNDSPVLHPTLERLAGSIPDSNQDRKAVVMEALEAKYGRKGQR